MGWGYVIALAVVVAAVVWAIQDLRDDVRRLRKRIRRAEESVGLPPEED